MKRRDFIVCGCVLGLQCSAAKTRSNTGGSSVPYENVSACGIDCRSCDMLRLPYDKAVQDKILPWYRSNKWMAETDGLKEALDKGMYCKGCNVDQEHFWSKGCKLAKCCLDEKKLKNCSECNKFPCPELVEWSKRDTRYTNALNYLTELRAKRQAG
jgi:hypothetical protein